jgi:hypothetical protein
LPAVQAEGLERDGHVVGVEPHRHVELEICGELDPDRRRFAPLTCVLTSGGIPLKRAAQASPALPLRLGGLNLPPETAQSMPRRCFAWITFCMQPSSFPASAMSPA